MPIKFYAAKDTLTAGKGKDDISFFFFSFWTEIYTNFLEVIYTVTRYMKTFSQSLFVLYSISLLILHCKSPAFNKVHDII